jgi:hypothetical protein
MHFIAHAFIALVFFFLGAFYMLLNAANTVAGRKKGIKS